MALGKTFHNVKLTSKGFHFRQARRHKCRATLSQLQEKTCCVAKAIFSSFSPKQPLWKMNSPQLIFTRLFFPTRVAMQTCLPSADRKVTRISRHLHPTCTAGARQRATAWTDSRPPARLASSRLSSSTVAFLGNSLGLDPYKLATTSVWTPFFGSSFGSARQPLVLPCHLYLLGLVLGTYCYKSIALIFCSCRWRWQYHHSRKTK